MMGGAAERLPTFFARARMSRPASAIGIASSWIGDGFSNCSAHIKVSTAFIHGPQLPKSI